MCSARECGASALCGTPLSRLCGVRRPSGGPAGSYDPT